MAYTFDMIFTFDMSFTVDMGLRGLRRLRGLRGLEAVWLPQVLNQTLQCTSPPHIHLIL